MIKRREDVIVRMYRNIIWHYITYTFIKHENTILNLKKYIKNDEDTLKAFYHIYDNKTVVVFFKRFYILQLFELFLAKVTSSTQYLGYLLYLLYKVLIFDALT